MNLFRKTSKTHLISLVDTAKISSDQFVHRMGQNIIFANFKDYPLFIYFSPLKYYKSINYRGKIHLQQFTNKKENKVKSYLKIPIMIKK